MSHQQRINYIEVEAGCTTQYGYITFILFIFIIIIVVFIYFYVAKQV